MGNSVEVNKRYYLANKEKVLARNKANKERNRRYVQEIKESSPCTDCKQYYPYYVMDFDHLGDDKEHLIAVMVNDRFSIDNIQKEINKCELVCSNCHRIRTHERRVNDMVVTTTQVFDEDNNLVQQDVTIEL